MIINHYFDNQQMTNEKQVHLNENKHETEQIFVTSRMSLSRLRPTDDSSFAHFNIVFFIMNRACYD